MKSLLYIPCLTIIVLFSCVSNSQTQTIIRVFDKPEEFVGRTVTFRIWVDEAFMSAVKFYGPSSGAGFEGTERVLDGYLMVVGDGRNTPQKADKWGTGGRDVLPHPKINVFVGKILGATLKEGIVGAAWGIGTFTIKEVEVSVKLDGGVKVIKIYVARLTRIVGIKDTSG